MSEMKADGAASPDSPLGRMKSDWDDRARENAKWYINTVKVDQTDEEFDETARPEVEKFVVADPVLTARRDLKRSRLLEIGCGIGRMTCHLAGFFGEVHSTDVSGEMIRQARTRLSHLGNVTFSETNGSDFRELESDHFDLLFSVYVFQHVPLKSVVESNIRDACRVLRPGGLFKFQTSNVSHPDYLRLEKNTWDGVTCTENDLRRAARENGVRLVSLDGLGTQYCWTILNKPAEELVGRPGELSRPVIEFFSQSDSPSRREVPTGGDYAWLTLIVSGLDPRIVDANSVTVELGDGDYLPCYVGWLGEAFEAEMRGRGWNDSDSLTQVNLAIPAGQASGEIPVRVRYLNNRPSEAVSITLVGAEPEPPKIRLVANDLDGGLDLEASGHKSRIRVFASGMDDSAVPGNVELVLGDRRIRPLTIRPVPSGAMHMTIAQLPGDLLPGEYSIRLAFDQLISEPFRVIIA